MSHTNSVKVSLNMLQIVTYMFLGSNDTLIEGDVSRCDVRRLAEGIVLRPSCFKHMVIKS